MPCTDLYRLENRRFTAGRPSLAFRLEKPVPERDARRPHFSLWPSPVGLALAVRGEVRRACSMIGTSAPHVGSGQAIWRDDCLENNWLVEYLRLRFFRPAVFGRGGTLPGSAPGPPRHG